MAETTMAAALLAGINEEEPKAPEPKRTTRRRSAIERPGEPLPEKPKRTRRQKDPALKKSHSFTLLLTEKMYQDFKKIAEREGLSMNGIATRLIRKYIALHDVDQEDLGF